MWELSVGLCISAKIHVDLETDFQVRLLKFCYQIKNWQGGSELLLIVMTIKPTSVSL
jgi:hypothetical protein